VISSDRGIVCLGTPKKLLIARLKCRKLETNAFRGCRHRGAGTARPKISSFHHRSDILRLRRSHQPADVMQSTLC
jgi:hypothetical protein